jgi:hypothetical protein
MGNLAQVHEQDKFATRARPHMDHSTVPVPALGDAIDQNQ